MIQKLCSDRIMRQRTRTYQARTFETHSDDYHYLSFKEENNGDNRKTEEVEVFSER
jgi:hypothetical protein